MQPDTPNPPPRDAKHLIGWSFVAVQGVLLVALVLLPSNDHWPTPPWLRTAAAVLNVAGFVLVGAAAFGLGRALTPTPVPNDRGDLQTTGLYRLVRHPIYTGVLAIVVALVVRSGSLLHLAIGIGTVVFFGRKAAWEEARLVDRYPGYGEYAARTPRFVPRPWRR